MIELLNLDNEKYKIEIDQLNMIIKQLNVKYFNVTKSVSDKNVKLKI